MSYYQAIQRARKAYALAPDKPSESEVMRNERPSRRATAPTGGESNTHPTPIAFEGIHALASREETTK